MRDGGFPPIVPIAAVDFLGGGVASPDPPALAGGPEVTSVRVGDVVTALSLTAAFVPPVDL